MRRFLCMLLLAGTVGVASAQEEPAARGPLSVRDMRPYDMLFLQFRPEAPDTLPARATAWQADLDIANNMLVPAPRHGVTVIEDNETQRLTLSWRRGLAGAGELAVHVPIAWRNGGIADPFISLWHRVFGMTGSGPDDPAGRDAYARYHSILYLADASGTRVDAGNAFGPGDISVTYKRAIGRTTPRSGLAARAGVKLPTGNPAQVLGSGGTDLGMSLDGRYNVGRDFVLYANGSIVGAGPARRMPNHRAWIPAYVLAVEYRPNGRDSFIWQVDGAPAAVRTGHPVADRTQATASFGYKRALTRRTTLAVSFSENGDYHDYSTPLLGYVGPDFTTSASIEWR